MKRLLPLLLLPVFAAASDPPPAPPAPSPGVWTEAFEDVLPAAKEASLPTLLCFTGSDWCPNCARLNRELFDTAEWKAWSATNLFLVAVDFPHAVERQHPRRRAINAALRERYGVETFPTLVLLGSGGVEIARPEVYRGAPPAFYERQIAVSLLEADEGALRAALGEETAAEYAAAKAAVEAYDRGVGERRRLLDAESALLRKRLEEAPDESARAAVRAELNKRLSELVQDYRSFQENGLAAARAAYEKVEAVRDRIAGPAGNPIRLFAPAAPATERP